jgi:hypothetical protein
METYSLDPENPQTNNEPIDDSSADLADTADDVTTQSESPYIDSELDQVQEPNEKLETDQKSDEVTGETENKGNGGKSQEHDETAPPSTTPTDENQENEMKEALVTNQKDEAVDDDDEEKGGGLPEI